MIINTEEEGKCSTLLGELIYIKEKKMRKTIITIFLVLAVLIVVSTNTALAKFPDKRVTFICVYAVGGGTDAVFRIIAKHVEKELGVSVVVKNVTGGAGQVGWIGFKKAKPDGYTLSHENLPQFVLLPLTRDAGFHYTEFEPLNSFATDNVAIIVRNDSQWQTLDDFINYAKKNPKVVTIGLGDYLQHHDLTAMLLEDEAKIKIQRVALGGGGPQKVALLGGHVDLIAVNISGAFRIREKIRVLAVASEKRHPLFPDAPTLKEKGYNIVQGVERGFIAPKGTPPDRLEFWRNFFKKLFASEALIKDLEKAGLPVVFKDHKSVTNDWKNSEIQYRDLLKQRDLLRK